MTTGERRSEIIRILTARRRETMRNLARELGVTPRTIRTDILVLTADYPLETRRGNGGCVKVAEWFHPHRNILTAEQQRVLSQMIAIGDERQASDAWARKQLARLRDPGQRQCLETAARDYADFMRDWNVTETILAYDNRYIAPFLRGRYGTLAALNQAWQMTIDDFAKVNASEWSGEPVDQATYIPEVDVRYRDLLEFRKAYRENRFTPYLKGDPSAAGYLRPAALRFIWEDYVAKQDEKLKPAQLAALPFPVTAGMGGEIRVGGRVLTPATGGDHSGRGDTPAHAALGAQAGPLDHAELVALWCKFLLTDFPMRHVEIVVGNRQAEFERFLQRRFPSVDYLNRVLAGMGQAFEPVARWQDVRLTPTAPYGPLGRVWMDFVRESVPVTQWRIRDTLPEQAFQKFALARHGSLAGINTAYGLKLDSLQQLGVPFGQALLVTFAHKQWAFFFDNLAGNYVAVFDYLIHRGLAVRNTFILVALAIIIALTVNPLAAYALSRFRLRQTDKIIVFCLATMAFPAAVAAIPGFLLLRDLVGIGQPDFDQPRLHAAQLRTQVLHHALAGKAVGHALKEGGGGGVGGHDRPRL